jgi:predicted amidohydrolase YtcJ
MKSFVFFSRHNDSHLRVIRAGLYYSTELRWDGVPSLTHAIRMLKDLAVLTDDYLNCTDEQIRRIESVLTICDGKIVHAGKSLR